MSLVPGTRLGPYEIVSALGAGGMGEVYRAKDTKLNRDVALKILPDAFTTDADRLARFKREAQVLASLNHPNIAAIYGLEGDGSRPSSVQSETRPPDATSPSGEARHLALVMELVEGRDLSEIIAAGSEDPALHLADALPIAKQIIDALEAAHDAGIVHRDLKPANIKVRDDGNVKVLDFGLAKAVDSVGTTDSANSPTLTARATEMGMILGTASYMSPEQARGRAVDKRTDVWAFGCVLYEMLTGKKAFDGEDATEIISSVVKTEPDWIALPASLPANVRAVITRCLVKDRKARIPDLSVVRYMLDEPVTQVAPASTPASVVPAWKRALPWAVSALFAAGLITAIVLWSPWTTTTAPAPRTLLASIGADASLTLDRGASAILSPDGTTLAFVAAQQGGAPRLFVRKLDQLQAVLLAGTDGAINPFFSSDGQWIAFFAGGSLKKVSVTGGAVVPICEAPFGRGGTWTDDDTIIFSPNQNLEVTLLRVPAAGGTPAPFATLSPGAHTQRWPQALPGGAGVLFTEHAAVTNFDAANIVVVPPQGGAPKVVVRGGYYGRYVPGGLGPPKRDPREGGYLVYVQGGTLFGIKFDLGRLEVVGQAVPVLQSVFSDPTSAGAQIAFASDGTLVYTPGAAQSRAKQIDWTTRDGKTSVLRAAKAEWGNPRFSPDGQKLAITISDGKQRDIWVYEWARDTITQLTFDPGDDASPVWTPDGKRIVFASDRAKKGVQNMYWVNADGTGDVHRLLDSPVTQVPQSWHPGGKFLSFLQTSGANGWDVMILPMDGDGTRGWTPGTPTVFLASAATELFAMFSPDGRWIAYASDEIGHTFEVFVRPFPGPGGPWRISTASGSLPRWSPTAHELLFLSGSQVLFAPYTVVGDSFRADTPRVWTPTGAVNVGTSYVYDIHPDGKRLALPAAVEQAGVMHDHVVFVSNFVEHVKRTVGGKK